MNAMDLREPVITEAHRALARRIALGFKSKLPRNVLVEDLQQAALLGLWDGLQKSAGRDYAPEQLEWYLRVRIRGAIIDELRAQDWLQRRLRKQERTGVSDVRLLHGADTTTHESWEETLAAPELDIDSRIDADRLVSRAVRALEASPRDQRDLWVVRGQLRGWTQKNIARQMGVSEPRIAQLHVRAIQKVRAALTEQEHESRTSHRRAGSVAAEDRSAGALAGGVSAGGLARPPAAPVARLVPGGARGAQLGGTAREQLRPAGSPAGDAGALAGADGGLAMTQAAMTEPVPSVLPEGGLDLQAELARYRAWLIEQALLRASNNIAHAGQLLGLTRAGLRKILRRSGIVVAPGPRGRYARRLPESVPAAEPPPPAPEPEPTPAPPAPLLTAERQLAKLMARVPWDQVEQLRAQGVSDPSIAKRLAPSLDAHRFTVEKALQRRAEESSP